MKNRTKKTEQTVRFAWYTAQEWEALRRVSADKGSLHTSYAEWEADAQEQLRSLQEQGVDVVPVPIQVAELVAWCKTHNRRIDGKARSEFTSLKVQDGEMASAGESTRLKATKVPRRANPLPLLDELEALYAQTHKRTSPPPYPYDEQRGVIRLPQGVVEEIRQMVRSGDVPAAVKRVAELTGAGLRVAKDYVDTLRPGR